jgi:hypothetical protein
MDLLNEFSYLTVQCSLNLKSTVCWLVSFFFAVLCIEHKAMYMLGKQSTTEVLSQSLVSSVDTM